MKIIKQLTCLIACFVVLSSSFMVGYAVDDEELLYTADDLIDWGWQYDEDSDSYYPDMYSFNPFITSSFYSPEKNFSDFDINVISWSSFPSYITDIVYTGLDSLSIMPPVEGQITPDFKVPFVAVIVAKNNARIFVGYNVAFGRVNNSYSSVNIFASPSTPSIYSNSCLYMAQCGYNGKIYSSGWTKLEPSSYGSRNNLVTFTSTILNMSSVYDVYLYGGNGIHYSMSSDGSSISSRSYPTNSDGSSVVTFAMSTSGFFSKNPFNLGSQFDFIYQAPFTPATPEQVNQQLQQEQNSLLDEQNNKLDDMMDATGKPDSIVDDYNKAESELVDDYNPDNLEDDLDIELDPSALSFIWDLFDEFVTADNAVFTLFISILSIGIIALILGR